MSEITKLPKGKGKGKPGIKANGKATPKEKRESFAAFITRLVQKKTPEKEIVKQFTTLYTERKGKAEVDFIKKRVDIYIKLANK